MLHTYTKSFYPPPSNQRASHAHTPLNNQRASHTLSMIKAPHLHTPITKELHTHTHSNNQKVHTPTHTFPTTKHFTHTPPERVLLSHPRCFMHTPQQQNALLLRATAKALHRDTRAKENPKALRFVCRSSGYLNTKTFNCDFLFRLMSRERLEEGGGRMAGESNYTQIFSLLIRYSFSSLLWLQLNLFLMRCGLSRSGR